MVPVVQGQGSGDAAVDALEVVPAQVDAFFQAPVVDPAKGGEHGVQVGDAVQGLEEEDLGGVFIGGFPICGELGQEDIAFFSGGLGGGQ